MHDKSKLQSLSNSIKRLFRLVSIEFANHLSQREESLSTFPTTIMNSTISNADSTTSTASLVCEIFIISDASLYFIIFPGVVSLIDCTHVPIIPPTSCDGYMIERAFVNRKRRHSINVQCIVDHRYRLLNIVAAHPGSNHDSFILRTSDVWNWFDDVPPAINGILLDDSGYPTRPWLMTPFAHPIAGAQQLYNDSHSTRRWAVQRTIEVTIYDPAQRDSRPAGSSIVNYRRMCRAPQLRQGQYLPDNFDEPINYVQPLFRE